MSTPPVQKSVSFLIFVHFITECLITGIVRWLAHPPYVVVIFSNEHISFHINLYLSRILSLYLTWILRSSDQTFKNWIEMPNNLCYNNDNRNVTNNNMWTQQLWPSVFYFKCMWRPPLTQFPSICVMRILGVIHSCCPLALSSHGRMFVAWPVSSRQ